MKWCCEAFHGRYDDRHERGLIIYLLPPIPGATTEPSFHLGFRALENCQVVGFKETLKGRIKGNITLNISTGMKFCPWCGAELLNFYQKSWPELLDERITSEFKLPIDVGTKTSTTPPS